MNLSVSSDVYFINECLYSTSLCYTFTYSVIPRTVSHHSSSNCFSCGLIGITHCLAFLGHQIKTWLCSLQEVFLFYFNMIKENTKQVKIVQQLKRLKKSHDIQWHWKNSCSIPMLTIYFSNWVIHNWHNTHCSGLDVVSTTKKTPLIWFTLTYLGYQKVYDWLLAYVWRQGTCNNFA